MSWDWLNTAGAASLGSFILGTILGTVTWLQTRDTKQFLGQMDRETQDTLARMDATTKETLGQMDRDTKATLQALGAGQTRLGEILAQMETNAETRYRDLRDRLNGEEGSRGC